jgi:HAD superfamily hydrolase (TIGR01549 family)
MRRGYSGVAFDLDGTLFDITEYVEEFRGLMAEAVYSLTGKRPVISVLDGYQPVWLPCEESARFLKSRWGVEDPDRFWEKLAELDLQRRTELIDDFRPYPDVEALWDLKKDFKLGLLSNAPENVVKFLMDHYGLGDLFPYQFSASYKTALSKPEPGGLDILLEKMGLERPDVVFVGDSDIDSVLCKNAGIPFILRGRLNLNAHYYNFTKLPDGVVEDFHQLRGVLDEMSVR